MENSGERTKGKTTILRLPWHGDGLSTDTTYKLPLFLKYIQVLIFRASKITMSETKSARAVFKCFWKRRHLYNM